MSALGQKRKWRSQIVMSDLTPKAHSGTNASNVRLGPTADIEQCDWMVMQQAKALLGFGSKKDDFWKPCAICLGQQTGSTGIATDFGNFSHLLSEKQRKW
jgi:hypothetical protein